MILRSTYDKIIIENNVGKTPLINTVDVILKINANDKIYPTIRTDDDKFYSRRQHSTNH